MDADTKSLWTNLRVYLIRWLIFGFIAGGISRPVVDHLETFWQQKLSDALGGLVFGFACGIVFTIVQNYFNKQRSRTRSWVIVISTWMIMKFVFAGVMLAAGYNPV
jgi:hypothetical protein